LIDTERARELLKYNPLTGDFFWRQYRGPLAREGGKAGSPSSGYIQIKIDGRPYKAHRLAWLITHGRWPAHEIDHINCDPSDNRLSNLREATHQENMGNQRKCSRNTSGFKGVSFHRVTGKWQANIRCGPRMTYLGVFASPQEASAAYEAAARDLFREFARAA